MRDKIIQGNNMPNINNFKLLYLVVCLTITTLIYAQGDEPFIRSEKFDFTLHDLNGNIVSSTDKIFTGKVILVTLWGTWCPPCISEIPTFIELQEQYRDSGLVIIAISFEAEVQDDLRREQLSIFVDKYNINYMVLDGGVPKNFETALSSVQNVSGFPVEILINKRGKIEIVRNGYGYSEVWAAKLKHEIKTLLNKSVN